MANDLLTTYLGSIDSHLLDYLDTNEDLSVATAERLRSCTSELLAGTVSVAELKGRWNDWFELVGAFVVTYGSADLEDLDEKTDFRSQVEVQNEGPPSGMERGYLLVLELELDLYSATKAAT